VDGAVLLGDDVRAWLRFPGGSSNFRVEQVGSGHALGRPNELLFLLGQIAGETVDAFRKEPDASVRDFDVGEDVRLREVRLLGLRCLVGVRSERGDVDQPRNAVVGSGAGDDASAVRVTDEDGRAVDPPQRASYGANVVRDRVEPLLGGYHLVTFCLKCGDHLAKARAVRPEPVTKDDARFALRRFHFVLLSVHAFLFRYVEKLICQLGEAAQCHTVTTSRVACRAPRATDSRSRLPVAVRAPTALGSAAALQAMSARSQRR
jgi:hypothetical protein